MNLVNFELKKIWKASKTRFLVVVSILLLLIFFFYCSSKKQEDMNSLTDYYAELGGLPEEDVADLSAAEWQPLLKKENNELDEYVRTLQGLAQKGTIKNDTSPGYTYYRKKHNQYLIDHKLKPTSERFSTRGASFSNIVLTLFASYFGIISILVIFGDSLTNNFESKSIHLILSQPISHKRFLYSSFLLTWFQSLVFSFLLVFTGFMIGALTRGIGSFNSPIIISSLDNDAIIPLWKFMTLILCLWVFVVGFALALHFLVSVILKKTSLAFLGTIWLGVIGGILGSQRLPVMMKWAHLNPFSYLNVSRLLTNFDWEKSREISTQAATIIKINDKYFGNLSLSKYLQNPEITIINGVLCLSICTVLILLLTDFLFSRKITV